MINVITAIGKVEWEGSFVAALSHPMNGIQIQRRCVDAIDVLAVVKVLHCDAVIISDHTLRVDGSFINELVQQNIRVIALTENKKNFAKFEKVEAIVLDPTNPLGCIPTIAALARVNKKTKEPELAGKGELIYVAGFGGGTGKTRLALELGYQFAKDSKTLVVDTDTYGPAITQLMQFPPESHGLLEICREVERGNDLTLAQLEIFKQITSHLFVLPGLTKSSRWVDLRVAALNSFWDQMLSNFKYVVVDNGPIFEPEPAIALDIALPKRNLVTTSAFSQAKKVALTTRADSVSVTRLIKGVIENQKLFADKEVVVAVLGSTNPKLLKEAIASIALHSGLRNIGAIAYEPELISGTEQLGGFVSQQKADEKLTKDYEEFTALIRSGQNNGNAKNRLAKLMPTKKRPDVA